MRDLSDEDETARVSVRRIVVLDVADDFALGWEQYVLLELRELRAHLPYADQLQLMLTCERREDVPRDVR